MKALVVAPEGEPQPELDDVPEPQPAPNEAVVSVEATSLSRGEVRRALASRARGTATTGARVTARGRTPMPSDALTTNHAPCRRQRAPIASRSATRPEKEWTHVVHTARARSVMASSTSAAVGTRESRGVAGALRYCAGDRWLSGDDPTPTRICSSEALSTASTGSLSVGVVRTAALWTIIDPEGEVWEDLPDDDDDGRFTEKTFWWSDAYPPRDEPSPSITVTGRRLDRPGSFEAGGPAGGGFREDIGSFMLVGLEIPAGCWEMTATYRGAELSYVLLVKDGS